MREQQRIRWPQGKGFAFTVFDDTDFATLENVPQVYSLLSNLGLRTTKSVWPLRGTDPPEERQGWISGATCEDPGYLAWVLDLQRNGFEIGYHSATFHRSERARVILGLERFNKLFGRYPRSMAQHCEHRQNEAIYWGNHRVSGLNSFLYNILTRCKYRGIFRGHVEGDRFFWGDICKARVKYLRNFIFADINTLKECPLMPYHDPRTPYVNYWYASSEGPDVRSFNRCLSEENQDRLEAEGGACIMYTHFGNGFFQGGRLEPRFRALMERLAKKNGWFVPVSDLLDYILATRGRRELTFGERKRLEWKWLWHKARVGTG